LSPDNTWRQYCVGEAYDSEQRNDNALLIRYFLATQQYRWQSDIIIMITIKFIMLYGGTQ